MVLPATERGQEGTPTWHHTNTFFQDERPSTGTFCEAGQQLREPAGLPGQLGLLGSERADEQEPL